MKTPRDGDHIRVVQQRGKDKDGTDVTREIEGTVRAFEQDGETRYELVVTPPDVTPCRRCGGRGTVSSGGEVIGFVPADVEVV